MTTKLTARQKDKLIEAAQNAIEFVVEGGVNAGFPIDMLRYDLCWPATGSDSIELAKATGPRRVTMKGLKTPTPARWASFGWTVVA
jgi:hypothetical protein